jgi:MFS transporter, DHA1 family, multidrug resistance protein
VNYRVLAIYLISALSFGAGGARSLAIPLYADQLGASRGEVGLLFSTFTVTAALMSLPSGLLADRFGRRNMVIFSLLVLGLSQLIAGLTHDVGVLFASQLLGGIGAGASQTSLMSALADLVPMERMGRAMGWLTLSFQTGLLAGPAVAGILLHWLTLRQDLLVTTIPVGVALVLAFWVSGVGGERGVKMEIRRPLRELYSRPGFIGLVIALLAMTILWGTYNAYIPVFGKRGLGLTGPEVGYLLAIQAIVNGGTRIPAGRLLDRISRKGLVVAASTVGFAAGLVVLPHLHGFWVPTVLMLVTIPMLATAFIAIGISFIQMATPESRGTATGVYSTVLFVGLGAGPAIFASLMDRSYVVGFTACALVGGLLAGLSLVVRGEPIRRRRAAVVPPTP